MKLELVPLKPGADVDRLVDELSPAFGGDSAPLREIISQTFDFLARNPRPDPWGSYLARSGATFVGACGFKSAPDREGVVEIAYVTFPAYRGLGHAIAIAGALSRTAFEADVPLVIAHTLPEENPSNGALRRSGFVFAGEVEDPEDGQVWRWEKRP